MKRPISMAVLCLLGAGAWAQQGDGTDTGNPIHIFKPAKVEPTPQRMAGIKAPAGFTVTPFATGLKNARIIAVAPNGNVYVSRRDQGDVLLLRDSNGDGRADGQPEIVASRAGAHGLAIKDNKLYLVTVKELFVADIQPDGRLGELKMLTGNLPDAGQHANRTIAFGPDGMLYMSVGSTCNDCNENNQENATILRFSPDFSNRNIVATGLRNTIGYDWQPKTGELWGFDHGIDFLGDEEQPEELNKIETGKQYGWPHVYAAGSLYPQSTPVGEIKKEDWKAHSTPMVLGYKAHAAPMQFVFYRGSTASSGFPAEYQGDAFVTMRGSWNRKEASGYEIVRVRFQDGQAKSIEPFVTGFLTDGGRTHIARPVGLAMARDGALLMADDANGVIYRVAYTGNGARAQSELKPPAGPMQQQASKGSGVPIAVERPQTQSQGKLTVSSSSFAKGGAIPAKYSEYADGVAPALSWTAVPNAKSYVVITEDPDAKPITPVIHWLTWNIPGNLTSLPEGLQEQPRLTEPDGVLQGRVTHGSTGWRGPQPPVGDPPHHYHFQVYALDRMLDVPWGADRDTLLEAMKGHVLAKGELVGTYAQKQKPMK
jgi:Raf kinase inhibitor-like YbhB/YbcL family protein